jgi:SSS family solute:Na+ symporter
MWGLITGMAIGLTRLAAKVLYSNAPNANESIFKYVFYELNWLFFCGWMFLICCMIIITVSLCTKQPTDEKIQGLVLGTANKQQIIDTKNSWNKWDVVHTAIILGITAAFYTYFW